MKQIFLALLILFSSITLQFGQDCESFYSFDQGKKSEMTTYDRKGKVVSITEHMISKLENQDGKLIASIMATIKDKNDKVISSNEFDVECLDGTYYVQMQDLLDRRMLDAYESMEVSILSTALKTPANLKAGMALEEGTTTIDVKTNGVKIMSIDIDIENRIVEGQEKLTTAAGTFDCWIISYDTKTSFGVSKTMKAKEWIALKVGIVRSETYNSKGEIENYTELTKFQ